MELLSWLPSIAEPAVECKWNICYCFVNFWPTLPPFDGLTVPMLVQFLLALNFTQIVHFERNFQVIVWSGEKSIEIYETEQWLASIFIEYREVFSLKSKHRPNLNQFHQKLMRIKSEKRLKIDGKLEKIRRWMIDSSQQQVRGHRSELFCLLCEKIYSKQA